LALQTHVVSGFAAYAPSDQAFLRAGATGFSLSRFAGRRQLDHAFERADGRDGRESLTVNTTIGAAYQFHRFVLQGDGFRVSASPVSSIAISDAAPNDI